MWYRNHPYWTFTISTNGLCCMLKPGAKPGDKLAVLDGGKVPVVLRVVGGAESRFNFITTAYVHGFIDGQAYDMMDEGKLMKKDILLE